MMINPQSKIWHIQFSKEALKQFEKIDKPIRFRIYSFLEERILICENPRILGKPLTGSLAPFWRFRVGDYRIVVDFIDAEKTIFIVKTVHRREVYN